MKCLNCDTEFEPKTKRAKYCSDRCKLQWNRNNVDTEPKSIVSNDTESTISDTQRDTEITKELTKADKLFEEHQPGYYRFGKEVFERRCLICDKKFKTKLQLLKTCSPEHMVELLDKLSTF